MSNVLIVDDSSTMRKIISRSLRQAGLTIDEIFEAGDGIEGLNVLGNSKVNLILSDINMPYMDGFEFVAALKADATLPYIPVIFLTSVEDGDSRGKELGAVGYLTKPVRADRLLELVAQHVPGGAIPIG